MTVGTISRLHIRVPPGRSAFARARVEDALRLAEPDDRLLVLRRLDLGRLAVHATSDVWASRAAERVGAQQARAVHGTTPGATAADAVWFHSFEEARTLLLTELMAGRMPAAWFWRLAVPSWHGARLVMWLPGLVSESIAQPVIEASLARAMVTVAANHGLGMLAASLAACPPPPGHDSLPRGPAGQGTAKRPERIAPPEILARAHRMLARLDTATRAEIVRILATLPADGPARVWIARLALVAVAPELASQASLLVATTEALIDVATTPNQPVRPANDLLPPGVRVPAADPTRPDNMQPGEAASPSRDVVTLDMDSPGVDTPTHPVHAPAAAMAPTETTPTATTAPARPETTIAPVPPPTEPATECASDAAGLFLLIRPLVMMGFLDWLDARPDLAADGFGRALLHDVATRMRIAETDPVFAVLGWGTSGIPQPQNQVAAGSDTPPPLAGLGREADQGWGEGGHKHRQWGFFPSPQPWSASRPKPARGGGESSPQPTRGDAPGVGSETDAAVAPGLIIPNPALLTAWRVGLDRWLRRTAGLRLTDVVHRRGWLTDTGEHLSVRFRIDDADIRLRRRALDIDPGWVSWLGRVVRYHYRDEPHR